MSSDPIREAQRVGALAILCEDCPPPDTTDQHIHVAFQRYVRTRWSHRPDPRSPGIEVHGSRRLAHLVGSAQDVDRDHVMFPDYEIAAQERVTLTALGTLRLELLDLAAEKQRAIDAAHGLHPSRLADGLIMGEALSLAFACDLSPVETGDRDALARLAAAGEERMGMMPRLLSFCTGARMLLACRDWPGIDWAPEVGVIGVIRSCIKQGKMLQARHAALLDVAEDRAGIVRRVAPTGRIGPHPGPSPALDEGSPEPEEDLTFDFADDEPPGVVVIQRVGGGVKGTSNRDVAKELEPHLGHRFPLVLMPDPARVRDVLAGQFPHADRLTQRLLTGRREGEPIATPPTCIIGGPGGGKSTYLRAYCAALGLPETTYACDGSSDNAAAGTPRRWNSGEFCLPLRRTLDTGVANSAIIWEEVNRAGGHREGSGGSLREALTSLLERTNSARYRDPYLEAECDLSHVVHLATANYKVGIAPQVRDRLLFLEMPLPGPEHTGVLAQAIALEVVREQALADEWSVLDPYEVQCLRDNWGGGSIRKLRRLVEVVLQARLDVTPGDIVQ